MPIISAHFDLVAAALAPLPVTGARASGHHTATGHTGLSISIGLFFGAESTDHSCGQFHWMVLVLVMADVTGVSSAAAGKPEPAMTLSVVFASSFVWQWLALLHSGVSYVF